MLTGILAPMSEEIELILQHMEVTEIYEAGRRKFHRGKIAGKDCVVALSRIGKVASSVTAAVMIEHFHIDQLVVTGVAGALHSNLKIGDLVIATECVQHDLDARPLFPQFEAPLLGKGFFPCDSKLIAKAYYSSKQFLTHDLNKYVRKEDLTFLGIDKIQLYKGQLCCGDQFVGTYEQQNKIINDLPNVLCVEMEGGAVGQVCYEYNVPYVVLRSISDSANHQAVIDFNAYVNKVAKYYTWGIIDRLMKEL